MEQLTSYSDQQLLQQAAKGAEPAFAELFNRYWDNIYSVAFVLTKSEPLAEDTVQEIFLKVWEKREELTKVERFDNYLFILARNHIFSEFKKLKVRQEHITRLQHYFDQQPIDPENMLMQKQTVNLINQAIAQLAPQQQEVYRLSREKGHTHEEIAAMLGISIHTVRNHMIRAIKNMRTFLSGQDQSLVVMLAVFKMML